MGRTTLGMIPTEVAEQYSEEADELGLSRAEYVRKCIEIGRIIFQSSGDLNIERLRSLSEQNSDQDMSSNEDRVTISNDSLAGAILKNLPTDEERALSKEEIREAIFGTEQEQREQVTNELRDLRKRDRIEPLVDDGYIKTAENNE